MISHQTPALSPLITQPPTPLLLQISRMAFCLNPAKTVSFPHNPTSPDLPGSVWITSPQLPVQPTRTRNVFECSVTNAGESRPPGKDSPSAAEPPGSAEPDRELSAVVAGPSGVLSQGMFSVLPASVSVEHSLRPNFGLEEVMAVLEALQVAQMDVTPKNVRQRLHVPFVLTVGTTAVLRSQCRGPVRTPPYAFLAMPGMRSAQFYWVGVQPA
ncbi:hypothetical protein E4T56_gene2799 [Termitomyces sp. T112]|nr:hypothetical protein E4T56_gene2799 [Termitomyces sp. T112]